MSGTINQGEFVLIEQIKTEIKPGDVIVFKISSPIEVCHRVVAIDPNGNYITRGDVSLCNDRNPVLPSQVVGRAIAALQHGEFVEIVHGSTGLANARAIRRRVRLRRFLSRVYTLFGRPLDRFRKRKEPV